MNTKLLAHILLAAISPTAAICGEAPYELPGKYAVEPPAAASWFAFDVQERLRLEARNNTFDFNDEINTVTDDTFLLQRFRLGLLLKPASWLKLYIQGQDSREIDSKRPNIPGALGAEGDDWFDLRQGWIELSPFDGLTARLGRQPLSYGDQRLIGGFEWNNFARVFDAVKIRFERPDYSVDVFASSVVSVSRDEFNKSDIFNGNESSRDLLFAGIYAGTKAIRAHTVDVYGLYLHRNDAPAVSNDDTNFATVGTRIKGDPKELNGFEWDFEGAFQRGEVRGQRLTAFAVHGGAGYNFSTPWKPRVYAEYNYATGDGDSTDDSIETFQNLFPTNHLYYGYMDLFSWQNLHNPSVSLRVTPMESVTVQLTGHAFWLATNEDAWYRANGTSRVRPVNAITRDADTYTGSEIDLTVAWKAGRSLHILAGYSHFFNGDYLRSTGPADDADFGYLQVTLDF